MAQPAPDDLYERDFYAWTQDQAARLRALAGDYRFDVAHVAEEIEDLGASKKSALASHFRQALHHLLLMTSSPADDPRSGWVDEVERHCDEMSDLLDQSPSLGDTVDVERGWRRALRSANRKLVDDREPAISASTSCPLTITDLTDDDRDLAHLEAAVANAVTVDSGSRGSA
jgi:hypothetical protein